MADFTARKSKKMTTTSWGRKLSFYSIEATAPTNFLKFKIMKTVTFKRSGYGQWKVSTEHYGKTISMHFTDAPIYDLIQEEEKGYKKAIASLRNRIINANKN